MGFDSEVMGFDSGVMGFDSGVMHFDRGVMGFDSGVYICVNSKSVKSLLNTWPCTNAPN